MELTDYKDDKIIQTLACACTPFSKTDILKLSERVGQKMKSTKAFLEKYMGSGVILKDETSYSVNAYSIVPSLWPGIVHATDPDHLLRMAALVRHQVDHSVPDFALAVNGFLHGRYYADFLERMPSRPEKVERDSVGLLVQTLSAWKSYIPFLKKLKPPYTEALYNATLLDFQGLRFTQDDVEVFEQVFLENNKETLHDKVWLGAVISFYNDFVMHAEVETARGEAGGGHSLSDRMMYNSQNK